MKAMSHHKGTSSSQISFSTAVIEHSVSSAMEDLMLNIVIMCDLYEFSSYQGYGDGIEENHIACHSKMLMIVIWNGKHGIS